MKNTVACLSGLMLLSGLLSAQTKPVVTLGGSYWYAKPNLEGDLYEGVTIDPGHLIGPYLNLRMGKWLLGTSMYFGTFRTKVEYYDPYDYTDYSFGYDTKRSDLNFSLGYSVCRMVNLFFGLKNVSLKGDGSFPISWVDEYGYPIDLEGTLELESKGTLMGGGLSGVIPFQRSPWFLFWSGAYLSGTLDATSSMSAMGETLWGSNEKLNTGVYSYTGGIGFRTPSGLSILVGYRGDSSEAEDGKENIGGFMATVAYTLP